MTDSFSLFDMLLLAISVYVLYAGITGKGRLYNVDNIKKGMEEAFKSLTRKLYIALGIAMIINSGASLLRGVFYSYEEVTAATDSTSAVYDWVAQKDLGAFSFLKPKVFSIISYVALGITLALIVLLIVKMRKFTDKEAAAKKSESGSACNARKGGCVLPSSAFEFDDLDKNSGSDNSGK